MQGDKIVQKILQDADELSEQIVKESKIKIKEIEDSFKDYSKKENVRLLKEVKEEKEKLKAKFQVLENIERKKIFLTQKQNIVSELKKKAFNVLIEKSKKEKIKLIEKLLKNNAEKKQTVYVLVDGVLLSEIKELSIVKKLSLVVKRGSEQGLYLSQENYDKNLLFKNLIDNSYEKNEDKVLSLLFD